tara:strand:- start:18 stop:176 length:159 start_codon:yes stop_codon:yes gene_type:complete
MSDKKTEKKIEALRNSVKKLESLVGKGAIPKEYRCIDCGKVVSIYGHDCSRD